MGRYTKPKDKFIIKCRKCNSEDVDITSDQCEECGSIIIVSCNSCDNKYDYHDFEMIEED